MDLPDKVNEYYVVEKTIEIVVEIGGQTEQLRIEALRSSHGSYSTNAYVKRDIKVALTYPSEAVGSDSAQVWISYDLPWTNRETADDALRQAMSFLLERGTKG